MQAKTLTSDDTFLSIDSNSFAEIHDLTLGMCEAVKFADNPVIRNTPGGPDAYRAGMPYGPCVLVENGVFRMWYTAYDGENWFTCYAESRDGYQWEKPALGLVEYKDSTRNNIVHAGFELMGVFRDDDEADPSKRYKSAVYGDITQRHFSRDEWTRYSYSPSHPSVRTFAYSPDGFRWRLDPDVEFPLHAKLEDGTLYRMDGRWFMAHQLTCGEHAEVTPYRRYVAVSYSDDFRHWTLAPEPGFYFDGARYGQAVQTHVTPIGRNYGNVIVGAVGMFLHHPELYHEETDLILILTNDGLHWRQPIPDQPFTHVLRRGDRGRWDDSFVVQGSLVDAGDKTLLYYSGSHYGNATSKDMQIGVAELRPDGYGYLAPAIGWNSTQEAYEGYLITKPILIKDEQVSLCLNIKGAQREGEFVKVEIQDESGRPIPEFALEECDNIVEDSVNASVRWQGRAGLDRLAGQRVRVKIAIRGINPRRWEMARVEIPWLYAFTFRKG